MADENKIPGRDEWPTLNIAQLYDTRSRLQTLYYNQRRAGASYANQFQAFVNEVDALIQQREFEEQLAREDVEKGEKAQD